MYPGAVKTVKTSYTLRCFRPPGFFYKSFQTMDSGKGRLRLLGKNYLMRSAQYAHLFTDAENEKDVHLHDTACNYLLCRKIWAGYGARRRG
jgi:hypothetical protein